MNLMNGLLIRRVATISISSFDRERRLSVQIALPAELCRSLNELELTEPILVSPSLGKCPQTRWWPQALGIFERSAASRR